MPGVLLRTDNLQSLSAGDVRTLIDEHALEVVIDLRTDVEAKVEGAGPMTPSAPCVSSCARCIRTPARATDLDRAAVKPWEARNEQESRDEQPVVRAYMGYLRQRPDSIVAAVRAIACARGAVLVHCAAGKDRTGVVVALALDAAGVDRATIVADYLATAERIDAIIARLLRSSLYRDELEGNDSRRHAPVPGTIERVLELVDERHGGSVAWLLANGLDESELQLLRRRLRSSDGGSAPEDAPA